MGYSRVQGALRHQKDIMETARLNVQSILEWQALLSKNTHNQNEAAHSSVRKINGRLEKVKNSAELMAE